MAGTWSVRHGRPLEQEVTSSQWGSQAQAGVPGQNARKEFFGNTEVGEKAPQVSDRMSKGLRGGDVDTFGKESESPGV